MKKKLASAALAALSFASIGVSPIGATEAGAQESASETVTTLNLRFPRLPVLSDSAVYEGWIIVDGEAITSGRFNVDERGRFFDEEGNRIAKSFDVSDTPDIDAFVLTIEPAVGDDPGPAATHILAGTFGKNDRTKLRVGHPAALGADFSDASGSFILATPSNGAGDPADERSGVWFIDPSSGTPQAGLDLPELADGWEYEGWAVIDGVPVSTGRFLDPGAPDSGNPFSGDEGVPPYPGEDFLVNAPDGVEFPADLRGAKIAISVEPTPDDSPAPFAFIPLETNVADDLEDHTLATLDQGKNPKGRAWITTEEVVEQETVIDIKFPNLPVLSDSAVYEGWAIVDGAPVTTGRFNVDNRGRFFDEAGNRIDKSFVLPGEIDVDAFVLTIEPAVGDDPAPAETHILAGTFNKKGRTKLTVDHPAALGADFSDASGSFILATPSNGAGDAADERSGVWFLDPSSGTPVAGLDLPELAPGWEYEGWAVIDGVPVSTGRFLDPAGADFSNEFSGDQPTPNYPGEDFLVNAPDGVEFPVDLRGAKIAISVEPMPDDSPAPFNFLPLVTDVADDLDDHTVAELEKGKNPKGRAFVSVRAAK